MKELSVEKDIVDLLQVQRWHILVMWTVWTTTDFQCYYCMDTSREEDQREMARQHSWGHEYFYTSSISSQLGPDKMEKHCSQHGLPEREDNVIVARAKSQVSKSIQIYLFVGPFSVCVRVCVRVCNRANDILRTWSCCGKGWTRRWSSDALSLRNTRHGINRTNKRQTADWRLYVYCQKCLKTSENKL